MLDFGFVLLVSEDVGFGREVSDLLEQGDFKVRRAETLQDATDALERCEVGAVVLEQNLGGADTLPRLAELRRLTGAPILLLASSASESDRVIALELGADGFLRHPVSARELLARIRVFARRCPSGEAPQSGAWRIDARQRRVFGPDGAPLPLTHAEFEILNQLARTPGVPVGKELLSQKALQRPHRPHDRSLENHVYQIRRKIREAGGGNAIEAARGRGFYFRGFSN